MEFLEGEVRYGALKQGQPDKAEELFNKAREQAIRRYKYLLQLQKFYTEI